MAPLARFLVDESHRQAWSTRPEVAATMSVTNPADASYFLAAQALMGQGFDVRAHSEGPLTSASLADVDVLVLPHCSDDEWEATTGIGSPVYSPDEIDAIERFVRKGGGLLILAETEQRKYGNSLDEIAGRFGVHVVNCTVQDPSHRFNDVSTWVLLNPQPGRHDLFAEVSAASFYRAGALELSGVNDGRDEHVILARSAPTAAPALAPLVMGVEAGEGRVLVAADSDFAGDDSIGDLDNRRLWINMCTWLASAGRSARRPDAPQAVAQEAAWATLKEAVEEFRTLQQPDGSVTSGRARAEELVEVIRGCLGELVAVFPHQADYFRAADVDLARWASSGFGVPDFLDSLSVFHPEQHRSNGVEHLALFPMYTQNGNPDRNLEAVIVRTVWPQWIADLEASTYDNAAFVPIEFVDFTSGYDTHSAVLFPETVATRETMKFTWGGIFCDREAARFRHVSRAAVERLGLALPPDAEMLLADQGLAQETFVLWDLIHDRTHSHGDLPFDPFMIKKRMPYWMYGLEELRCDLTTYRETVALESRGVVLARHVRLAILFDRLFRFPTTGDRNRNYDGLAGQIIFAWLHRAGVVEWRDNTLRIDWISLQESMNELCERVERLYRDGIDQSRLGYWLAAYEFVSCLVPPHPGSVWAKGPDYLPTEPKGAVDAVLPDEFPLNVFYESLRAALAPSIASARGITGAAA